jgi:hypothetical protein
MLRSDTTIARFPAVWSLSSAHAGRLGGLEALRESSA